MSRKSSKPILLLHGALGCAADFTPLQAALNGTLPSVALDFPGHGQLAASNSDRFSIEEFAETIGRYAAGTEPLDIFGYSMGGYVALYFASLYPERVGKILTLGTKFDWTPETGAREANRLNPQKIVERVPQFAAALAQKHGIYFWENNVLRTAELLRSLGAKPLLYQDVYRRIEATVCIARGTLDNMVTEEECLAAADAIPRASYRSFENQPHPFDQFDQHLLAGHLENFFSIQ